MFPFLSKKPTWSYASLSTGIQDQEGFPTPKAHYPTRRCNSCSVSQAVKLVSSSLVFILVGFFLGHAFARRGSGFASSLDLEVNPYLFEYKRVFGEKPSNESNAAWGALMPKRGGFFNHPQIAPARSAFAVFHQLHCLDALREAYWTTLDAAASPTALDIETIPFEISPPHMRHCIDLLRQTLMCNPDLTVELKNETLGGVTGFGTVHQCRSWDQLMGWVERWEDVGAPKHALVEGDHSHAHHHGL